MSDKKSGITALIIMDGFGVPVDKERSAILEENTKNIQELAKKYPSTKIYASEEEVGLPKGQSGTSEVGHLTIGAGRIVFQPIVRVNKAIEDGSFYTNPVLLSAMENAKIEGRSLHLLGMPSDGGIHSHIEHLFRLLDMAKQNAVKNVYIHFFGDGRDTPPKSAKKYIKEVQDYCEKIGVGEICNIIGRYYALDRDKNFDRNKVAYEAMVDGKGKLRDDLLKAVDEAYAAGEKDEFLTPIIKEKDGKPLAVIKENDSVISYNFRADRERQLAYVFVEDNDLEYVKKMPLKFVTMTNYDETFTKPEPAFDNIPLTNILSEVVANAGLTQAKLAETEKYAHVTFFFNASKQDTFEGEERFLINSEKRSTYEEIPQMGAYDITKKAIEIIKSHKYDYLTLNFANCDMVGHSGNKEAAKKAVSVVDECVKKVVDTILEEGGRAIITADHGNADIMQYEDGSPNTAHTTSIVPLIVVDNEQIGKTLREGGNLSDIAPTLLTMMNLEIPNEMTGKSFV